MLMSEFVRDAWHDGHENAIYCRRREKKKHTD